MIERGALVDEFDDDEEGQSEDESNVSGDEKKNKTPSGRASEANVAGMKLANYTPGAQNNNQQLQQTNPTGGAVDYSKILVAGEGFGREFLKGEVDRLIRMLQEKQQVG